MTSPINPAGYQDLRDYVQASWTHIELRNLVGTAVLRLPVTDPRVTWTHAPGAQELELRVILNGSDADVPKPTVFRYSVLYKVASGGTAMDGPKEFPEFNMAGPEDVLTVRHRVQIPQVV